MGKAIFIKKIEGKNAILIYILVINLLTLEYAFFVAKLLYAIPNFFVSVIALFFECCVAKSKIFLLSTIGNCFQFNFTFAMP